MARNGARVYTSSDGLHARAARAHEDPVAMTRAANDTRIARLVAQVLRKNPDLSDEQAAKAARLLLRDEMVQLRKKGRQAAPADAEAAGATETAS
jgi:hypothetical protein